VAEEVADFVGVTVAVALTVGAEVAVTLAFVGAGFLVGVAVGPSVGVTVGTSTVGEINITLIVPSGGIGERSFLLLKNKKYPTPPRRRNSNTAPIIILTRDLDSSIALYYRYIRL